MTILELKKAERNIEFELLKNVKDELAQKRCFVAELSKKVLDKYMAFDDVVADNTYSIYNLPILNEDLNIIDFQINSLSVHVIATVDRAKNINVHIPKIYKLYNIKPDVVVFINFSKSLAKAEIVGFLTDIDLNRLSVPKSGLKSANDLMDALQTLEPKTQVFAPNVSDTAQELMLAYIDNDLSEEGERFFFKQVISSIEVRKNYKLFYALSCDFISIAQNSNIEKEELINAQEILEEAIPEKIELFSRSSFLVDKAIAKLNDEQDDNSSDEEIAPLEHSFYDTQEENNNEQNEEEQEFAEETTTAEESTDLTQEEPAIEEENMVASAMPTVELLEEPMAPAIESSLEDEFLSEDTPISLMEEEEFGELPEEEELLLEDTELEPLQEYEEESLQEPENISEQNNIEETTPETVAEENISENIPDITTDSDDDFLDIAEDANFDLLDADVEALLEDNEEDNTVQIDEENLQPVEDMLSDDFSLDQSTSTTTDEPSQDTGDDLFAFLTDLAEEAAEQENNQIQPDNQYASAIEQTDYTASNQVQQEFIQEQQIAPQEYNQQINKVYNQQYQEDAQADYTQEQMPQQPMNTGFEQQQAQQFAQNAYYGQQQYVAPQKKSAAPLLATLMVLSLAGYGFFMYKDVIMDKINMPGEIQGLKEEDTIPAQNVVPPAPVAQQVPTAEVTPQPAETTNEKQTEQNTNVPATGTTEEKAQTTTAEKIPTPSAPQALPALPTAVEPPKPKNLNDAIANALSKDFNGVRISRVSWEISETLVDNPEVKRYLTIAGKSIKNALTQDLMAATEPSFKDSVKISITYRKEGTISKVVIDSSSGSKQIDDIILKSVKDTLNYVKMPALNLNQNDYSAHLTIGL